MNKDDTLLAVFSGGGFGVDVRNCLIPGGVGAMPLDTDFIRV